MRKPLDPTDTLPDCPGMEDPSFEDRAYPDAPLAFRAWARESRDAIRLILASDLGRSRNGRASTSRAAVSSPSAKGHATK